MPERALLVIADIGGYTRFMKVHRVNLAHAQTIIASLLEAVIDGAAPKLKLAKLEGDAAFFYAKIDKTDNDTLRPFTGIVTTIRRRFLEKQAQFESSRLCNCDSCVQAKELTLKFVAHVGEVAFQRVKRLTELAGVDVIFVHRLLKNNVPIREYVLMSDPVFAHLDDDVKTYGKPCQEDLEGLGEEKLHYIDFTEIQRDHPEIVRAGLLARFVAWVAFTLRSLPFIAGMRRSCEGFRNFPAALPPEPRLEAAVSKTGQ